MKNLIALFVVLCCIQAAAQEKKINLSIDGGFFFQDLDNVRWELYYSFPDNFLKYIVKDSSFASEFNFDVKIKAAGIIKSEKTWVVTHKIKSMDSINKSILFGTKSFVLPPGQYNVEINVFDINNINLKEKIEFEIYVQKFKPDRIELSTLQLANLITNADSNKIKYDEMFKKFNLYVIPNPSLEFVGSSARLTAYSEIYNANEISPEGIIIRYKIFDGAKREMYKLETIRENNSDISPEGINIELNDMPTGVYYIEQSVIYPKDKPTDSVSSLKKYYLINPNKRPVATKYFSENQLFSLSTFSTFDERRIDDELKKASVIARDDEIDQIENLGTIEAKQRYLFEFWKVRDTDTATAVNERYEDFNKAVKYANTYFKTSFRQGWDTDRGKIVLKYGLPTERNEHDQFAGNNPYEEWFYENVQGGVFFYFVDRSRLNNFKLYHSTASGEMYYPDWYNDYVPTQSNKGNPDTQYMNDDDYRK